MLAATVTQCHQILLPLDICHHQILNTWSSSSFVVSWWGWWDMLSGTCCVSLSGGLVMVRVCLVQTWQIFLPRLSFKSHFLHLVSLLTSFWYHRCRRLHHLVLLLSPLQCIDVTIWWCDLDTLYQQRHLCFARKSCFRALEIHHYWKWEISKFIEARNIFSCLSVPVEKTQKLRNDVVYVHSREAFWIDICVWPVLNHLLSR